MEISKRSNDRSALITPHTKIRIAKGFWIAVNVWRVFLMSIRELALLAKGG